MQTKTCYIFKVQQIALDVFIVMVAFVNGSKKIALGQNTPVITHIVHT